MRPAVQSRHGFQNLLRLATGKHRQIVVVSILRGYDWQPIKAGFASKEIEFLPKQFLERLIDVDIAPFLVLHEGNTRAIVHETVKERLALAQCRDRKSTRL